MTINPILPIEPLIVLLAAIVAGGLFLAWRSSARLAPRVRGAAFAARAVTLAALAAIALNFGYWRKPEAAIKPRWCVLIDRSGSMATADVEGASRWDAARRIAGQLAERAGSRRDLDLFAFSDDVDGSRHTVESLNGVKPEGKLTDLCRVLESVTGGAAVKPAGIVVLTDGRQTVSEPDPLMAGLRARALDAPVFPVALGKSREVRDIAVRATQRLALGFVGQPLRIRGEVMARWPGELEVTVQLVDGTGRIVATNAVKLAGTGQGAVVFTVVPDRTGYAAYKLSVPPWEGETDVRNNEAPFEINTLDRKIRVLLVEGVPYWDSKFLGQHLRKQPTMEVTAIYRTAPDRFFKTDPAGNPSPEDKAIFPESAAELGIFDIVVLGKGTEYFLTPQRLAALKAFVADQGGSVVFARGRPYADQGGGLEDLEPVEWGGSSSVECRLVPRPEGEDAGLFAGLLPGRDDAVWTRLPAVKCSQTALGLKSFAQVLAEGRRTVGAGESPAQAVPLLIGRRSGKGMAVTVNVDGFWQWSFFPTSREAAEMYEELWTQLLLWAGAYAEFLPGHDYALRLSASTVLPGAPVRVQVRRRGRVGNEVEGPRLKVTRGTETIQETVLSAGDRADRWETALTLSDPGLYRVTLVPPAGADKGQVPALLLQVKAPPGEMDEVNPDPEFLAKLAEASGGRPVPAETLADVMDQRERDRRQHADQGSNLVWEPIWDRGGFLALIVVVLAVEWTLRRRNGLA